MKYKILADLLRQEIRSGSRPGRLPTEKELAERYNMSRQTVRHALQILTEEGLIQRRQGSGSYVCSPSEGASTAEVAVITTFGDDYIFPRVLHDTQDILAQRGYTTLAHATGNLVSTEREILQRLIDHPVSGVLAEGSKSALPNPNVDLYRKLRDSGTPVVFFHSHHPELQEFPRVVDDNYGGGYLLTRHLIDQGHRHIGGIFKSDDIQGPQRYYGMVCAMRDAGLTVDDRAICWYDTEDRREMMKDREGGMIRRFLNERLSQVSAVVCFNDQVAHQLIGQLLSQGSRVPRDVAVVGFDNSYYSQIGPVPITSLRHKDFRTGQAAAELLLQLIRTGHGQSKTLGWELMVRESSVFGGEV